MRERKKEKMKKKVEEVFYRFATQLTGSQHNGHQDLAVSSPAMGHEVGAHRKTHGAGGDRTLEGLRKRTKTTVQQTHSSKQSQCIEGYLLSSVRPQVLHQLGSLSIRCISPAIIPLAPQLPNKQ